ncbi:MAG: hypothetical protein WC872_00290 [Candidatus Absconditabacterales bacterium]
MLILNYPDDWQLGLENVEGLSATFYPSLGNNQIGPFLGISNMEMPDNLPYSIDEFVLGVEKRLKVGTENYVKSNERTLLINNLPGKEFIIEYSENGQRFKAKQICLFGVKIIYIINYGGFIDMFDMFINEANNIMNNIIFKEINTIETYNKHKVYKYKNLFTLEYPGDWTYNDNDNRVEVAFSPPNFSNRQTVAILVEPILQEETLNEIYLARKQKQNDLNDYHEIKCDDIIINNIPAKDITEGWVGIDGIKLIGRTIILNKDNSLYIIICIGTENDFWRFVKDFENIVKSFKLE